MKHVHAVTRVPAAAVTTSTPLLIKLNGVVSIVDDLLLAQRQSPWKTHFPPDSGNTTTPTV